MLTVLKDVKSNLQELLDKGFKLYVEDIPNMGVLEIKSTYFYEETGTSRRYWLRCNSNIGISLNESLSHIAVKDIFHRSRPLFNYYECNLVFKDNDPILWVEPKDVKVGDFITKYKSGIPEKVYTIVQVVHKEKGLYRVLDDFKTIDWNFDHETDIIFTKPIL